MAIGLLNKPNIDTSDSGNYPFGAVKDDDGSNNGTPVDREVYNDMHQFFEWLMAGAGTPNNGLPDNISNGLQYINALEIYIRTRLATETEKGVAEIATQAETLAGSDDTKIVTPLKLEQWLVANFEQPWVDYTPTVVALSGSVGAISQNTSKYKVIGKTLFLHIDFTVTTAGGCIGYTITLPAGVVRSGDVSYDFFRATITGETAMIDLRTFIQAGANVVDTRIFPYGSMGDTDIRNRFTIVAEIA